MSYCEYEFQGATLLHFFFFPSELFRSLTRVIKLFAHSAAPLALRQKILQAPLLDNLLWPLLTESLPRPPTT
jgi:hypothetical protein